MIGIHFSAATSRCSSQCRRSKIVNAYKTHVQEWFAYLNELENQNKEDELKKRFGYLFACVASLAQQLDDLKISLPETVALKGKLENLIKTQLEPVFGRLIAYYEAGKNDPLGLINDSAPPIQILRHDAVTLSSVLINGLSSDWSGSAAWAAYVAGIAPDTSVFGNGTTVFAKINHCSTHTLFKSIFDQFLKVFAGVVTEANAALDNTLSNDDTHEPHYALFLTFLRLFEYARTSGNTLTQKHLDFYYRTILGLKEKGGQPGRVHLLAELARQAVSRDFKVGEQFRAGKDDQGKDAFFANENDFVANQAKVAALRTLYRHNDEPVDGKTIHQDRLFASPVANSDDGLGAPLTSTDGSWHPFFNKVYTDGALKEIRMPEAEVGFAIASHYLLMAGGDRKLTAYIGVNGYTGPVGPQERCSMPAYYGKGLVRNPGGQSPSRGRKSVQARSPSRRRRGCNRSLPSEDTRLQLPDGSASADGETEAGRCNVLQIPSVSRCRGHWHCALGRCGQSQNAGRVK